MALPGVGEETANRIIGGRPFQKSEDLLNVPGIGPKTLEKFGEFLVFE
jgi:competence protein ComEA